MLQCWKDRARALKREVTAVYLAYRDPRTPWPARLAAACVVAYALSPIDLIPDFIPILGYLDDIVLIPLGVILVIKLIPPEVMTDCRARADTTLAAATPLAWLAAGIVVLIWIGVAAVMLLNALRLLRR